MTGQREVTKYATASLVNQNGRWFVIAQPWEEFVGEIREEASGWTAVAAEKARYAGLWPTKQAAAEVLVKQAGYELEKS